MKILAGTTGKWISFFSSEASLRSVGYKNIFLDS